MAGDRPADRAAADDGVSASAALPIALEPRPPRELGGPTVLIALGCGALGGTALAAVFWNLIAGIVLGVLVGGWLLKQLCGELMVAWECRRPVHVDQPFEQVIQDVPQLGRAPRAIEPPHLLVPIIAQAEVIKVERA